MDLCEELGPGLLVMGRLGPVGRLLVGSVSTNVLRAATGPVLIHAFPAKDAPGVTRERPPERVVS